MGIPAPILRGDIRKYRSVHTIYIAVMTREVMARVNISFWARAKGGADDLGNIWKPLAPSTHAYKPLSPMEKNDYKLGGKRERGLLTPAQNRKWSRIFARQLRILSRKMGETEAKKEAAKRAWTVLIQEGATTKIGLGRITDINIRTGALVAATAPGKVANNRYYPPKNQLVAVRPRGGIKIDFALPYIDEVDKVRPVIPSNIDQWIVEAHDIAILEAKRVYDQINLQDLKRKQQNGTTDLSTNKRKGQAGNKRDKPGPQGGRNSDTPRS